jgi:hypothetical protein
MSLARIPVIVRPRTLPDDEADQAGGWVVRVRQGLRLVGLPECQQSIPKVVISQRESHATAGRVHLRVNCETVCSHVIVDHRLGAWKNGQGLSVDRFYLCLQGLTGSFHVPCANIRRI